MPMEMQTYRDGHKVAAEATESIRGVMAGLGLPEGVVLRLTPIPTSNASIRGDG
ncbi:hypothetical protein A3Q37_05058 [Streptomyces sp. PTY087I2]|nr:hypothetical protein A3Q37_05058 [Streptomyces sp. PTY087I2]